MGIGQRLKNLDNRVLGPVKPPPPPPTRGSLVTAIVLFVTGLVVYLALGDDHAWAGALMPGMAVPLAGHAFNVWRR